jgi:amyloid beta A4 protein
MEDYLVALRSRDNTPAPLLTMDREHEEQMINNFREEMEAKIKEKEREQQEEKDQRVKEKKAQEIEAVTEPVAEIETVETEPAPSKISGDIKVEVHATAVHHDQQLEPRVAHAQAHEISHSQATYSVRRVEMGENRSVYVTLAFAGVALMVAMVIGVVVLKKRSNRYPHHQGFIEVDTAASPEEKHVANMQINGYENPTYKYFEASTA